MGPHSPRGTARRAFTGYAPGRRRRTSGEAGGSGVVSESLGRMPARSPMTTSSSSAKTVSLPKNV